MSQKQKYIGLKIVKKKNKNKVVVKKLKNNFRILEWEIINTQTKFTAIILILFVDSMLRIILTYQNNIYNLLFDNSLKNKNLTLADLFLSNFISKNEYLLDNRFNYTSLFINCIHFLLLGVGIPLCHFSANKRLVVSFFNLIKIVTNVFRF